VASVGVQMMMVREQVATDGMLPVLGKIAGLGYNSVEVSQVATDEANVAALGEGTVRARRRGRRTVGGAPEGAYGYG